MGREGKTWGGAVWLGGRLGTDGVILDWLFRRPVTPLMGSSSRQLNAPLPSPPLSPSWPSKQPQL